VAAFKRGVLDAVGRDATTRMALEDRAYERCVRSGEAAIGRASFAEIGRGERPGWGPREPDDEYEDITERGG
jgi:hypothetical protein